VQFWFGDPNLSTYRNEQKYENVSTFQDAQIALAGCYILAIL